MKKFWLLIALLSIALLAACGGDEASSDYKVDDVVQAFKDDGLDIGDVTDLPSKEFGNTREEGKRILVPSLGEDAGGRLFKFKDQEGLDEAKAYYDELGNSSPMFYSHTHANGLFLLQMNGEMEDAEFEKYVSTMDELLK